jgi:hypothetical protein
MWLDIDDPGKAFVLVFHEVVTSSGGARHRKWPREAEVSPLESPPPPPSPAPGFLCYNKSWMRSSVDRYRYFSRAQLTLEV